MRGPLACLLCLCLGGCGDPGTARGGAGQPRPAQPPPPVEHDFGVIPHGEARQFDYVFDVRRLGIDCVPLRAHLDCSCGHATLLLRHRNGTERALDGSPWSTNAPTADETLVARVVIDTLPKDPVDLPPTTVRGHVLLQPVHDRDGSQRLQWPLLARFGIECPVLLQPFAALDFGRVPQSSSPELVTTLRGDAAHPGVVFGPATSSDPAIEPVLERAGDHWLLRARCRPSTPGNHVALLTIGTDLPSGYCVNVGVQWKVVPDLEALPMAKLSLRADLRREQRPDEASSQFLLLRDHDPARTAGFTVHELVDADGRDARAVFAVTFAPVPTVPGQQRMFVRYLGGHPAGFRGRIVLTKGGAAGPFLSVELVAFPTKAP
ncbi:MAG: hypothetical protein FJ265_04495 [Planctomycetes bacterium]|nr:hypothetical protein [Planctomycetota bacterium]